MEITTTGLAVAVVEIKDQQVLLVTVETAAEAVVLVIIQQPQLEQEAMV